RVFPTLRTIWETLFGDVRAHVDADALRAAVQRTSLLDAEHVIRSAWQEQAEMPARRILPPVLQETLQDSAEAMIPETTRILGAEISMRFNVVVPEAFQYIDQYVGQQIVGIGERTLMAVRQVIREGFQERT